MKSRIAFSSAGSGSPVHSSMKNFLNSSAIAQPLAGISIVDEPRLLALALEGDILANVEASAVEIEAPHLLDQGIEQERPIGSRHREGADIDVGRVFLRRGAGIGAVAPMIVAVGVDEDEAALLLSDVVQQIAEHSIIGRVDRERFRDERLVRLAPPDLEAPALVRRALDGGLGRPVEIELEA